MVWEKRGGKNGFSISQQKKSMSLSVHSAREPETEEEGELGAWYGTRDQGWKASSVSKVLALRGTISLVCPGPNEVRECLVGKVKVKI